MLGIQNNKEQFSKHIIEGLYWLLNYGTEDSCSNKWLCPLPLMTGKNTRPEPGMKMGDQLRPSCKAEILEGLNKGWTSKST